MRFCPNPARPTRPVPSRIAAEGFGTGAVPLLSASTNRSLDGTATVILLNFRKLR